MAQSSSELSSNSTNYGDDERLIYLAGSLPISLVGLITNALSLAVWFKAEHRPAIIILKALAVVSELYLVLFHVQYHVQEEGPSSLQDGLAVIPKSIFVMSRQNGMDKSRYFTSYSISFFVVLRIHLLLLCQVWHYLWLTNRHEAPFFARCRVIGAIGGVVVWCGIVNSVPVYISDKANVDTIIAANVVLQVLGLVIPSLAQPVLIYYIMMRRRRVRKRNLHSGDKSNKIAPIGGNTSSSRQLKSASPYSRKLSVHSKASSFSSRASTGQGPQRSSSAHRRASVMLSKSHSINLPSSIRSSHSVGDSHNTTVPGGRDALRPTQSAHSLRSSERRLPMYPQSSTSLPSSVTSAQQLVGKARPSLKATALMVVSSARISGTSLTEQFLLRQRQYDQDLGLALCLMGLLQIVLLTPSFACGLYYTLKWGRRVTEGQHQQRRRICYATLDLALLFNASYPLFLFLALLLHFRRACYRLMCTRIAPVIRRCFRAYGGPRCCGGRRRPTPVCKKGGALESPSMPSMPKVTLTLSNTAHSDLTKTLVQVPAIQPQSGGLSKIPQGGDSRRSSLRTPTLKDSGTSSDAETRSSSSSARKEASAASVTAGGDRDSVETSSRTLTSTSPQPKSKSISHPKSEDKVDKKQDGIKNDDDDDDEDDEDDESDQDEDCNAVSDANKTPLSPKKKMSRHRPSK